MNAHDFFFVHETSAIDEFSPAKMTKIELATLVRQPGLDIVQDNIAKLTPVSLETVDACARKENALHLKAQMKKPHTDKQTEIASGFFKYNNGIYFYRIYKLVGTDFVKVELTKVPLGQRAWMHKNQTVNGLTDAMTNAIRGAEEYLLPHHYHKGTYETLVEFKKKFL